ncbi:protease inhibitor I9 family protein [Kribbella sp. NBC_00359]|uniref:protease inhibitor I9 family protein n=1 Tax=Kribbella sp. NBC_00359 TaxID=2975966 RepID=UPI002E20478E
MFRSLRLGASAAAGIAAVGVLLLGGLTSATASVPLAAAGRPRFVGADAASGVPEGYIVKLRDNASLRSQGVAARAKGLMSAHKGTVRQVWTQTMHGFVATMSEAEARKLASDPNVESVQQDQYVDMAPAVSVPGTASKSGGAASNSAGPVRGSSGTAGVVGPLAVGAPPPPVIATDNWGLDRIDQRKLPLDQKFHYDSTRAGNGVTVYLIAPPARETHHDFAPRVVNAQANLPRPNQNQCQGEGTNSAGAIGGTANGVAKQVNIVVVPAIFCDSSTTVAELVSAFEWIVGDVTRRPAVIDFQRGLACTSQGGENGCTPENANLLRDAQVNALDHGIQVVVAMNAFYYVSSPCKGTSTSGPHNNNLVPGVLYVGETDIHDTISGYDPDTASCVGIWAPGVGIKFDTKDSDDSEATGGSAQFATDFVAGGLAMLLSEPEFADASRAQVTAELLERATPGVVGGLGLGDADKLLFTKPPGSFTTGLRLGTTPNVDGALAMFGVNPDGRFMDRFQTGTTLAAAGSWGPWTTSATAGWASMAAERNANGKITLIGVTSPAKGLWQRQQAAANENTWTSWSQLDNPNSLGLTAVSLKRLANGRLMMFGSDSDGQAYFRTQTAPNATTWSAWAGLPFGQPARSITAESNSDGRVEVFASDTDGQVWRIKQVTADGADWTAPAVIPGVAGVQMVAASRHRDGRVDLFAIVDGGELSHATQSSAGSDSYTALTSVNNVTNLTSISASVNSADDIDLIASDTTGAVLESIENGPDSNTWPAFTLTGTIHP